MKPTPDREAQMVFTMHTGRPQFLCPVRGWASDWDRVKHCKVVCPD